jgi:hypothetical protein
MVQMLDQIGLVDLDLEMSDFLYLFADDVIFAVE